MAKDGQDANVNLDVETEENVNTNHELNASALMTSVFAVTIKLPSFYQVNAQFWFDSAESQFRLKGIRDETTKFDYVMSSLPEEVAMQVIPATRR